MIKKIGYFLLATILMTGLIPLNSYADNTIVRIHKELSYGDHLFIRGGDDLGGSISITHTSKQINDPRVATWR